MRGALPSTAAAASTAFSREDQIRSVYSCDNEVNETVLVELNDDRVGLAIARTLCVAAHSFTIKPSQRQMAVVTVLNEFSILEASSENLSTSDLHEFQPEPAFESAVPAAILIAAKALSTHRRYQIGV